MSSATALVIERNEDVFTKSCRRLVIEPPACAHSSVVRSSTVLTFNYRTYCYFEKQEWAELYFGLESFDLDAAYDEIVVFMPKSKAEFSFYLDLATRILADKGSLYLVGAKKEGVASAAKLLSRHFEDVSKLDSAKHCQLWQASLIGSSTEREAFHLENYFGAFDVTIGEQVVKVASFPGVFASGKLDEGTKYLLSQDIRRLKGRTLDFGCGSGVIGAFLKKRNPEIELEAIDLSWFAIKAARKTYEINGIEGDVYPSDGWDSVVGRVNGVVTNPPFHQGVRTEYETTENFLQQSVNKMAKYAPLYVVANSFLRYQPIIEGAFGNCSKYAESNKFNVYYAER